LNISAATLGKRLNKSTERVLKLEENEIQGKLMLKHIQRIGKIFRGRFEYVFIPENISNLKEELISKKAEENAQLLKKPELLSDPFLSTSPLPPMPSEGWIFMLRYALKMSRSKLQENLNIPYPYIQAIEDSEKSGQLVNKMLRNTAYTLGYRIEYVFIPMENLHKNSLKNSFILQALQKLPLLPQKPVEGWIRAIRNSQGITQAELAERLKITERQVSLLEKNEAQDGLSYTSKFININLNELAKALDCRFDYIFIKDTPLYDETVLSNFKSMTPFPSKPQNGWIFQMRKAQEIYQIDLAKRINCTPGGTSQLEAQEAYTNPISKSAQDVIRALKCRFEYVLIPENFEVTKIHSDYAALFEELKRLSVLPHRQNDGWIHWLRCSLKMTQAELADRIGVPHHQLSKIERREACNQLIDKRVMRAIKALGCRLEYRIIPHAVPQKVSSIKQVSHNELFLETLTTLSLLPLRPTEGWIKALRTAMGLSQHQLAKKINCTAMQISCLENHESKFLLPHQFLSRAARSLGCRTELVFIPEDITSFTNAISNPTPLMKAANINNRPISPKSAEYDQDFLEKFEIFSLLPSPPKEGWIRILRKASRIFYHPGVTRNVKMQFYQVEKREIKNKLYSQSTATIAKALKCRIEYFLIPENISSKESALYKEEFGEQLLSLPIRPAEGWIYTMRKALKLSPSELAQRTNLHFISIYHRENEERKGNLIHKLPMRIAQTIGFRLEYFFVPECIVKLPR
ncbi:MAG: helix-turn-helix domain-containing protein, partial [Alphaproteobacteria bacterium]|nr:helix-turn-helix domain-containing protein [Alphaproteobacteria bacterium]